VCELFLCVAPIIAQTDLIAAVPSNLAAVVSDHMSVQLIDPPVHFPGLDLSIFIHSHLIRSNCQIIRSSTVGEPNAERLLPGERGAHSAINEATPARGR